MYERQFRISALATDLTAVAANKKASTPIHPEETRIDIAFEFGLDAPALRRLAPLFIGEVLWRDVDGRRYEYKVKDAWVEVKSTWDWHKEEE